MRVKYKETCDVAFDVVACLLVSYGWAIPYHLRRHSWTWVIFLAVLAVALIVVTAMRNHHLRGALKAAHELIEAQRKLIDAGEVIDLAIANARLRDVALSAIALMTTIEHGLTPELHAIKRDLAAVGALYAEDKPNGAAKP